MTSSISVPAEILQSIAHLGPVGTYAEAATLEILQLQDWDPATVDIKPLSTIAEVLVALAEGQTQWGVVPIENSLEGGVSMTLDTLWRLAPLHVHRAIEIPIRHCLITTASDLSEIKAVYSHPQALGQCQEWLRLNLSQAMRIATRSTTEELPRLATHPHDAVIASRRAAELYDLPVLAGPINDHPGNFTRFWLVGVEMSRQGSFSSIAFSLPENLPGTLLRPLQVFADRQLNMSRIESRPTKKSAGTYVFFVDIEHPDLDTLPSDVLEELQAITETLKFLGSYSVTQLT